MFSVSLFIPVLAVFVCGLPSVFSNCLTCCADGSGCSSAYNGQPGVCCTGYYLPVCCPSGTTCRSDGTCHNDFYLGNLTLGGLIGVICGVVFGIILLIIIIRCICARPTQTVVTHTAYVPAYNNPTTQYVVQPQPVVIAKY